MTTAEDVNSWVQRYQNAWITNDPDDVAALFTEDATYEFVPNDPEAAHGRDEIVAEWMDSQDSPETWKFDFEFMGFVKDDTALVRGVTEYLDGSPTYDNLWFIRLDDDGRATHFTEWYHAREGTGDEEEDDDV
jgi:uncharacterized protein (TIGR02246 family)